MTMPRNRWPLFCAVSGAFDPYAASSARLIAALGTGLMATFIAAGLFGSVAPATAQDDNGNVFGYDDHAAERLQQRYSRRAVRHSRAPWELVHKVAVASTCAFRVCRECSAAHRGQNMAQACCAASSSKWNG